MVNNSDTKVSYQGNGQTTVFPFSFPFIQRDYIKVAIYDSLTDETKTIDSDYYVDTVANTVIYPGYEPGQEPAEALRPPILPATSTITIYRQTDVDQLTDLGEKYPLKDIENMADKITEILQEYREILGRCIKMRMTDKTPDELIAFIGSASAKAHQTKEYAAQVAAIRDYIQYLYDHLPDEVARHNQDKEAHPYLRKEIEQLHNLFFKDLIEQINGQLTISADSYDTPVRMILTEDNEITFGENEFLTKNFEYDEDGNVMPVA